MVTAGLKSGARSMLKMGQKRDFFCATPGGPPTPQKPLAAGGVSGNLAAGQTVFNRLALIIDPLISLLFIRLIAKLWRPWQHSGKICVDFGHKNRRRVRMSASSEAVDQLRKGRSKISNGSQLFLTDGIDGRSSAARRYRDICGALHTHLGGDDMISEPRKLLVRRAAGLVVWLEIAEGRLVISDGEDFDVALHSTATNSLRRILVDLGLDPSLRDVTPDFRNILDATPERPRRTTSRRASQAAAQEQSDGR